MNVKNHTIGILGSGWVAEKMAITLAGMKGYECLAIASRTQAHADDFATKHGIARSYGSYEELVKDDDVELVYIATPHALHYEHARLCIEHNKPILCEAGLM